MKPPNWLSRILPLAGSLANYHREDFVSDLIAGLIVAIMLVPQAMAYAMLAGLPPQVGLYASIVPLLLYSFFGSSTSLAVGPVAMVSLLVVSGVGELATPGSAEFIGFCVTLALMIGVLQILMAAFRLGFLVNFISHPVLVGFTSAAAIVIGSSQLKHLLGVSIEQTEYPFEMIWNSIIAVVNANPTTSLLGSLAIGILLFFSLAIYPLSKSLTNSEFIASNLSKVGPLVAVVLTALCVFAFGSNREAGVSIVGEIPSGLPGISMPNMDLEVITKLLPLALIITMVGYLESISVAKALAGRRREKIDPNRELFALGIADVGAAFTGGYPVTGGFSRSMVNFSAGVRTQIGGVVTALLVAISVAFLTPAFYYIPKTVLAAIIIVAVVQLIDFKTPIRLWRYSRNDAIALGVTFLSVLGLGIETGIMVGIASTIILLMWKMSRPHVVEVGKMKDGHGVRNVDRYNVETTAEVFAMRLDESLNFANAPFLESLIMEHLANHKNIKSVLMICSGVNDIDATGLEVLESIHRELDEAGVSFYLSDVKGPVTDRFKLAGYDEQFLNDHVFMTARQALDELSKKQSQAHSENVSDSTPRPIKVKL